MSRLARYLCAFALLAPFALVGETAAQCILANPSFEIEGSGSINFGGWNQFGQVGTSATATHGATAARVTGPNTGGWDVSGYWQPLDCSPGDTWAASGVAWHTATRPLSGQSQAIVNVEWRDGGGNLIDYESHTVATASTPLDDPAVFSFESQPAPTGTVSARYLLGVLQGPSDPIPDVYYDQVTFDAVGPPSIDDLQWNDFPGGNTVEFGGRTWRVKGPGYYGPGQNLFCDGGGCVWVDIDDRLHMTVQNLGGAWYSTEVVLEEALGYGDYIFTTVGRVDLLDPHAVLGLFLWQYGPCWSQDFGWWNPYNEIDVEMSRWSDPGRDLIQFVAQPYDWPGNIVRFDAAFAEAELSSHAFLWLPDRVEYRSWRGGPDDEAPGNMIYSWTYNGPHIPRPEQPRVHINLWKLENVWPSANQEVILDEFTFVQACEGRLCEDISTAVHPVEPEPASLTFARPNPFNPNTTITYTVRQSGPVEIVVYDVTGRRIRSLVGEVTPAGVHHVVWNGRDDAGNQVASGVYLYRFQTGRVGETKKMVLLK